MPKNRPRQLAIAGHRLYTEFSRQCIVYRFGCQRRENRMVRPTNVSMTATHLRHDGRRLHCLAPSGEGRPLLMLHGVTRRCQTFQPLWSALAGRWRIHAFDFRGHGASDRAGGRYQVCDYVQDAIAYIHSRVRGPVIIYGHSLGAMVAAGAAAALGDRVVAIVMEDPPLHTMGRRIGQTSLLDFFLALREFAGDTRIAEVIAHDLGDIRVYDSQRRANVRLGEVRDAVSLDFMANSLKQLDPDVLDPIVSQTWLDGFDAETVFREVRCPSLLIQADPDSGGMLTDGDAAAMENWVPNLIRVKLMNCGHVVHWCCRAELLNKVHTFLKSLSL